MANSARSRWVSAGRSSTVPSTRTPRMVRPCRALSTSDQSHDVERPRLGSPDLPQQLLRPLTGIRPPESGGPEGVTNGTGPSRMERAMNGIPPAKKMALAHSTSSTDRDTPGKRWAR